MAQVPANRTGQGGRMATRRGDNPLERLRQNFDTLFDRLWGGSLTPLDQDFGALRVWDFDVKEDDREITVRAEIPGFNPNEVDVQVNDNVLTIRAEREQREGDQGEYRSFFRAVTLPSGVDAEHARASYNNGVLELHIPRLESSRPRHIQIEQQSGGQQQVGGSGRGNGGQTQGRAQQTGAGQQSTKEAK